MPGLRAMSPLSAAKPMTQREYMRVVNRQRRLPDQLAAARARVKGLEAEALRLGMEELLTDPAQINQSWSRAVTIAQLNNTGKRP